MAHAIKAIRNMEKGYHAVIVHNRDVVILEESRSGAAADTPDQRLEARAIKRADEREEKLGSTSHAGAMVNVENFMSGSGHSVIGSGSE